MKIEFEFYEKDRCNIPYSEKLAKYCGIKCVKEKDHTGKHVFYVDWNVFS